MKGLIRNPMVVARKTEGERYLIPLADDLKEMRKIFRLNDLGWFIWRHLDSAEDLNALSSLISREFEVDQVTAHKDAEAFIEHLIQIKALLSAQGDPDAP